jgi:riboflavin biosynthesis pyrimidine reductase
MESEKNERPEITCLMISTVDGKGTGDFLFHKSTECSLYKYFEQETKLGIQGYILGTNTLLTDYAPKNYKPDLSKFSSTNISKSEDYIAKEKGNFYVIAFDIEGEIPWKENKGKFLDEFGRKQVSHIFEVVTEKASKEYLAYLRSIDITYIIGGKEEIDINYVLKRLKNEFGMNKILLEGGPTINSSFFNKNLVDKIILYQVPLLGNKNDLQVFGEINMKELSLQSVEMLDDKQTLMFQYEVKNK